MKVGPWLACGWTVFVFYAGYWSRHLDARRAEKKQRRHAQCLTEGWER
jgi:hypothetical protein